MRGIRLVLLCVGVLHGCADTRWSKAGADPAMLAQDLEQCWGMVALQVPRPPAMPRSMGTVTGSGGIVINTEPSHNADSLDRLQREERLLAQCMNGKGYARVPAGEANRK